MQMVNCTTPANFFHVLRRQLKRDFRKPLVVFTPKSLLRHPSCNSTIEEFTNGKFQEIIDDSIDASSVKKLVLCSGKLYYELLQERIENKRTDVAIVRLEQLYPIAEQQLQKIIKSITLNILCGRKKSQKIWVLGVIFYAAYVIYHLK